MPEAGPPPAENSHARFIEGKEAATPPTRSVLEKYNDTERKISGNTAFRQT